MAHDYTTTLAHFRPLNTWKVYEGARYNNGNYKYIMDKSTRDLYLNEEEGLIRFKCVLLTLGTPVVHGIAALVTTLVNLARVVTFYHFWKHLVTSANNYDNYSFSARLLDTVKDIFHIIFAPVSIVLLEAAAIFGAISPRDGRKLYASTERFTYGHFVLAPCFQPSPEKHLFGGSLNQQNAF